MPGLAYYEDEDKTRIDALLNYMQEGEYLDEKQNNSDYVKFIYFYSNGFCDSAL